MEYTEEEIKAIESLKIKAEYIGDNYIFSKQATRNLRKELDILLNLIEKQKGKIEVFKNASTEWINSYLEENEKWQKERNENGRLKRQIKNSIPKEAIREKIKEIKNELDENYSAEKLSIFSGNTYMEKFKLLGKVYGLKELLGE